MSISEEGEELERIGVEQTEQERQEIGEAIDILRRWLVHERGNPYEEAKMPRA